MRDDLVGSRLRAKNRNLPYLYEMPPHKNPGVRKVNEILTRGLEAVDPKLKDLTPIAYAQHQSRVKSLKGSGLSDTEQSFYNFLENHVRRYKLDRIRIEYSSWKFMDRQCRIYGAFRFFDPDNLQHEAPKVSNGRFIISPNPDNLNSCTARTWMYLNIKPEFRLHATEEIVNAVWGKQALHAVRMAGPGEAGSLDNLVLELSNNRNGQSEAELLRALYNLDRYMRHWARPERRRLMGNIDSMPWVSIGAAPLQSFATIDAAGNHCERKTGVTRQTFSMYRAQIIFMALERTVCPNAKTQKQRWWHNGNRFSDFQSRTKRYFKKHGIDVNTPWAQSVNEQQEQAFKQVPYRGEVMHLTHRFPDSAPVKQELYYANKYKADRKRMKLESQNR